MLLLLDFSKAYTCSWLGYEHRCDPKAGENLTHAKIGRVHTKAKTADAEHLSDRTPAAGLSAPSITTGL